MSSIGITGAGGFVGRRLVPALREAGRDVRGLRRPGAAPPDGRADVTYRDGDVRSVDTARALLDGCDAVIHLAASFSPVDDVAEIIEEGTRNVLEAAREAHVGRFVLMSCLGAEAAAHSAYLRAKWKAEQLVRSSDIPYVILRPSLILGPGDEVTRPLAEMIRSLPATPVPGSGEARTQPIDVDDLVRCVLMCLDGDDLLGEMISVGGPMFVTYRELADLVSGCIDVTRPKVLLADRWLGPVSSLLPPASRGLFTSARLSIFRHGTVASQGIVQRMFGFEPRSVVPLLPSYLAS